MDLWPDPDLETATKMPPPKVTERQAWVSPAEVLRAQLTPLSDVMTLWSPSSHTATKRVAEAEGLPKVTERQALSLADVLEVQVTPLLEVMTLLPVPVQDVATKMLLPNITECQLFSAAAG